MCLIEVTLVLRSEFVGHVSTGAQLANATHPSALTPTPTLASIPYRVSAEKLQMEAPRKGLTAVTNKQLSLLHKSGHLRSQMHYSECFAINKVRNVAGV